MSDWLSKLDPNTVLGVLTALLTFAAWVYHDIRGDAKDNASQALSGLGKQTLHALLSDPSLTDQNVRNLATAEFWSLVTKTGIQKTPTIEALATPVLEHLIGDALTALRSKAS